MTEQEIAQHFHDAFTDLTKGLSDGVMGQAAPEDIVRGMMLGAASFCAATWAASSRASGVPLPMTKATMVAALDNFWGQSVIPQTLRR